MILAIISEGRIEASSGQMSGPFYIVRDPQRVGWLLAVVGLRRLLETGNVIPGAVVHVAVPLVVDHKTGKEKMRMILGLEMPEERFPCGVS